MFLEIPSQLRPDEVGRLTVLAETLSFVDGRVSNQGNPTKHNLQVDRESPVPQRHLETARIVSEALGRSREFREFAFPKRMSQPFLSRYDTGMSYGAHPDAAFLLVTTFGVLRTDISATVFITDPPSYDGGELMVRLGTRNVEFKGRRGRCPGLPMNQAARSAAGQRGQPSRIGGIHRKHDSRRIPALQNLRIE
jgi:PKHD-type hydroxylase